MKRNHLLTAIATCVLLIGLTTGGQHPGWLLHGKVTWGIDSAAVSVKLRLLQGNHKKAVAYTNAEGRYGFFNVPGQPSDYTLEISFGGKVLKRYPPAKLKLFQRGARLDIQLPK